ncbi:MAG TPA: hypothetical protein VHV78_05945 [Gemmatimonadaceae bacterium]|nr:hypothetical protein [Gemmatimonadaceae bacterium]
MSRRPTMWQAVLATQWKWTRPLALLGVLVTFAIPILSLRLAEATESISAFVAAMQSWGVAYAVAAAGLGLITAIAAWGYDHRLRHVYALSLPVARWRYVAMRFGAGLVMLAPPIVALFASCEIVAHSSGIPPALHAYPVALTLRFSFASIVAYALFFAISSATGRTAGYILGAIAFVIVAQIMLSSANITIDMLSRAADVVFAAPGLLAVFAGRWTLIDV